MALKGINVNLFFDRAKVIARIDKKKLRVLAQVGAYGRKVVRNSMRPGGKKGKISAPGEPPRSQTGKLKNLVLFQLHPSRDSVVVGAAKFNQKRVQTVPAPQLLEDGGSVVVRRFNGRRKPLGPPQTWRYKARPFIAPGMDKTLVKMKELIESVGL